MVINVLNLAKVLDAWQQAACIRVAYKKKVEDIRELPSLIQKPLKLDGQPVDSPFHENHKAPEHQGVPLKIHEIGCGEGPTFGMLARNQFQGRSWDVAATSIR